MNKWFIGIKKRGDLFDTSGFEEIKTQDEIYYADPFLLDGFLFYEDYDHKKGVISCMNLRTKKKEKVLEEAHHLSYPCVFKAQENYFMIPEGGQCGEIWLYIAHSWPKGWQKAKCIKSGLSYADPQIYYKNNYWYLFVTVHGDNNLEVYRTNNLLGEWGLFYRKQERNSRSAGNLFEYEGKTLRPVQNCDIIYGGGIIFKEIEVTESSVKEVEFRRIDATWRDDLIGTHTFNFDDNFVVIDGKIKL